MFGSKKNDQTGQTKHENVIARLAHIPRIDIHLSETMYISIPLESIQIDVVAISSIHQGVEKKP